ncbi:hypothetical protein, partial [Aphanothece stagnina]|uniref:hypothetical protein n=1 Tax=Aphanothece stagnina TaxID=1004305 RepID=UPI00398F045B
MAIMGTTFRCYSAKDIFPNLRRNFSIIPGAVLFNTLLALAIALGINLALDRPGVTQEIVV